MPVARFQLPDGRVARFEVPDGTTPEQAQSLMETHFKSAAPMEQPKEETKLDMLKNWAGGGLRGAGSIGATALAPIDMYNDYKAGKGLSLESNRARRADMDYALRDMGVNTDSGLFQVGKLASEVAGTSGTGKLLGMGAEALGASPTVVNALASGGMQTGGAPGALNMLTRIGGGAVTGGVSAGQVDPAMAAGGAALGGALPVAGYVGGQIGNAVSGTRQAIANKLMQSAVKPTIAQLKSGDAKIAVQTLLDNGINPNAAGVEKLRSMIDGVDNQITSAIGNSTATVNKQAVLNRLADAKTTFGNQVSPAGDLAAIDSVGAGFMTHPNFPLPQTEIPVQAAQDLKRGTYQVLAKKYGQMGGAETEAQKALARGLKEEIATAVPGIGQLNAEQSKLLTTLNVAERRALMEMNKNPGGLSLLANNPVSWAMFMADKSALFKSLAARMVNPSSATAGGGAVNKLLSSPEGSQMLRNGSVLTYGANRSTQQ